MDQDHIATAEDRDGESASPSLWLWVVGIIAVIAIIALIVGDTSSRERYLVARQVSEPELTQEQTDAVDAAVAAVQQAADDARGRLEDQAAEVRSDLDDLGVQLHDAAETRGHKAAAHLDAAIAWLDETIADIDDAAQNAGRPAVQDALDNLHGRLEDVQDRLVRASRDLARG
jgi:chromosome segregation ATPase